MYHKYYTSLLLLILNVKYTHFQLKNSCILNIFHHIHSYVILVPLRWVFQQKLPTIYHLENVNIRNLRAEKQIVLIKKSSGHPKTMDPLPKVARALLITGQF